MRRLANPDETASTRQASAQPAYASTAISWQQLIFVWFVGALASAPVLWHLSRYGSIDMYLHAQIVIDAGSFSAMPWYSLLYPLLFVFGAGATHVADYRPVTVTILCVAMGFKLAIALWVLARTRAKRWVAGISAVFVCLAAPLSLSLSRPFYLGKITPSIWHNSTTVMLMPVSLLLFVVAVPYLQRPATRWPVVAGIAALMALNLAVKPNYGMVFLPVFGIYAIVEAIRHRRIGPVSRYMALAVPAVIVLAVQYYGTYVGQTVDFRNTVDPLVVWSAYTANIPLSVFESLALVVVATIILWRNAEDRTSIVLAWSCLILAIGVFSIMAEERVTTGELIAHGNWSWGMPVAIFVLYVVLAREWLRQRLRLARWVRYVIYVLTAVYAGFGINYLVQLMTSSFI